MDRERLSRIRNFQSQDWYPALIIRPLSILLMLVIADWKFLTPNRLTTISNVCKLVGAWLILYPSQWIWAVVFLQLGIIFDHLDGTMARYRRAFTKLGSFYDKVSDMVTWSVIMLVAGWQVFLTSGEPYYILLAASSAVAMNVMGYIKWLAVAEAERMRWLEARKDPEVVARRTAPIVIAPPPARTRSEWVTWFFKRASTVWKFDEMDLWFWLGLALLIGRLDWGIWLLAGTQVINMFVMIVIRAREVIRTDRQIARLEADH